MNSQITKQISFICLFLQQKQTSYQGVVFDFAIIVAKKVMLNPDEGSLRRHFPTAVLLASSWPLQSTLFTLLVWDGVQRGLFERLVVSVREPLSQVCLAWLLTSAVVCGRRPQRRELTGQCPASFADKWGIGFQCGKDDGGGQEWLITTE